MRPVLKVRAPWWASGRAGTPMPQRLDAVLCVLPLLHAHTDLTHVAAGRVQPHHLPVGRGADQLEGGADAGLCPPAALPGQGVRPALGHMERRFWCWESSTSPQHTQGSGGGGVEGRADRPVRVTSCTCQGRRRARCVKCQWRRGGAAESSDSNSWCSWEHKAARVVPPPSLLSCLTVSTDSISRRHICSRKFTQAEPVPNSDPIAPTVSAETRCFPTPCDSAPPIALQSRWPGLVCTPTPPELIRTTTQAASTP
jgi:hypothetical protein